MFAQKLKVVFNDGTEQDVTVTQWSMGQFAMWAMNKGYKVDMKDPGLMALVMLRFQAFAELHRDATKARPTFEKWDVTVSEVNPVGEQVAVDPTNEDPSDA